MEQLLNNNSLGLYVHIPFCAKKCNYCNFYSFAPKNNIIEEYVNDILNEISRWGEKLSRPADSLYIGGGTPSLIGVDNLNRIINRCKTSFLLNGEITIEVNPKDEIEFSKILANRVSVGVQSANNNELLCLGRRHNLLNAQQTIDNLKKYIKNFSLDVIIGIPYQTKESLKNTLDFCINNNAPHISCYMLKREKGTPFYNATLPFLTDDATANLYLFTCNYLKKHGYNKYEVSNFAKPGYESYHNLKYWLNKDYLGIGPAAHSRIKNKRFYYKRSLNEYLLNHQEIYEGPAGSLEEKIMLMLRTNKGFDFKNYSNVLPFLNKLKSNNYINLYGTTAVLTDKGALVENTIIANILELL